MSTPAVVVDGVSKRFRLYHERNQSLKATILNRGRGVYEEFWALRDVSFEIPQGETFGLIGENGSGKSTMLKCLARILEPDHGSVAVHGRVSALLELGAGFHPELSGRENVYLNASILGLSKREVDIRFDEIVEFAGLERFIDTPVKNYSSGMYVRLGFAVAVQAEPEVLLIDEVLAVGDESFQRRCNERLSELRHAGTTIVVVSHSLGSVRNICDRVAWLEHGELRGVGPTSEVVDDYLSEVQTDREGPPTEGARWGSGEARIEALEIVDPQERPLERFCTGDDIVFRMHYCADQRIVNPVFGVGLHTTDGMLVTGPNTREAGEAFDHIEGAGHMDLVVNDCMLLPGTYDLSASLTDREVLHMYDYRHRALRFDVDLGEPHESFGGVLSLGGRWKLDPVASVDAAHG
ncbi:MAG: ABC transporter ATP-binding protein [Acidimicrobiales bacterium]|nr:ABC transporter ATP-binding protein [Acidimicrobiales bacterium]